MTLAPLADADLRCQALLAAHHRILEVMARGTPRDVVLNVIAFELEGLDPGLRCVARPASSEEATGERPEADGWEVFARGSGGRVVGVLCARPVEPRAPGAGDRAMLEAFARLVAVAVDRAEAEEQAARGRELLDAGERLAGLGSWEWDVRGGAVRLSSGARTLTGAGGDDGVATMDEVLARVHAEDRDRARAALDECVSTPDACSFRFRIAGADGAWRTLRTRVEVTAHLLGRAARVLGVLEDVTERDTAATRLAESERRYHRVFEAHPQPLWIYDLQTLEVLDVNAAAVRDYGWPRDEFLALTLRDLRPASEQDALDEAIRAAREAGDHCRSHEVVHRRRDGTLVQMEVRGHPLDFLGRRARLVVARDLTAQRAAERALRESEALFRAFVEQANDIVVVLDAEARLQYVSPAISVILGHDAGAMLGRPLSEYVHEEDVPTAVQELGLALIGAEVHRCEIRARRADGGWRVLEAIGRAADLRGDSTPRVLVSLRDTTERREAEEALRASEERFRSLSASSPLGIFQADLEGGITYVNPRTLQMWERPEEEMLGRRWLERVHPEDAGPMVEGWRAALAAGADFEHEFRIVMPDGTHRWMRGRSACMLGADGVAVSSVGTVEDVTERRELEGQLRQAQKMEAVGQLAGGIAHDFNNLLTVIKAHSEFLQESVPADDPGHEDVREIARAAARAAALTRQLLAFSRKQLLRPQAIDLNAVLHGMEPMLRRLIGEDVAVAVLPTPEPAVVRADPGQVEQVIMNLALNARDAMPGGGTLSLALSHVLMDAPLPHEHGVVQSGGYVLLKVSDTGTGMPEAVRQRVFEPFFTTKPVGKGTGLGLSTVYGIVRQSGGHVTLESAEGEGTTFHVYLPQLATGLTPVLGNEIVAPGGSGTVLLVEDETPVRSLARRILERRGYTVLEARHGRDAIEIATRHGAAIDLLLTDVVMPGMNGRELADTIAELRPGIRVVYMSGYTDEVIVHRGALSPRLVMVHKPFTTQELSEAVAKAMGR